MEQTNKPTEATIIEVLGNNYGHYSQLLALAKEYKQEWTYTKNSGWTLKIFDRK
jgi:hypothetical protein